MTTLYRERNNSVLSTGHVHTALADHAHVGTCTSAVDLVHELCHSLANTDSELEPSVRHFSALV